MTDLARIVRTPAGLAWRIPEPGGGRLRTELQLVLITRSGQETLVRVPAAGRAEGDAVVLRGEGLVRPSEESGLSPVTEMDGGPR